MKKSKWIIILVTLVLCMSFATACSKPDETPEETPGGTDNYYTVTFDSQGGSAVESQSVYKGNPVRRPETPAKDNFSLKGWYKSAAANAEEWIFATDRVNSDITLYASWLPDDIKELTSSLTFNRNSIGYTVTGVGQEEAVFIPAAYQGQPVTEVGESAFARTAVTAVTIPDTVTKIGLNAFNNCSDLVTLNISENSALTTIDRNAFSGNGALKAVYIPEGVTIIEDSAFNNCGSLETINVAAGNTVYSGEGNNLIEKATNTLIRGSNNSIIPASITTIALAAFRRANGMTELVIPVTVTTIGNYFIADSTITTVRFQGTQTQWEALNKTSFWNYGNRDVVVICAE